MLDDIHPAIPALIAQSVEHSAVNCTEPDRVRWTMKGRRSGVAVKIGNDEQECPPILGTARVVVVGF